MVLYQPFELTVRDLLDSGSRQRFLGRARRKFAFEAVERAVFRKLLVVPVVLDAMNLIGVSGY